MSVFMAGNILFSPQKEKTETHKLWLRVVAGETAELAFTAARSGQFAIELHRHDSPEGVAVGIFTVHEP